METPSQPKSSSSFFTLIIAALMYSCAGLAAGVLWTFAASALGLPQIGILPILALWWVWLFLWLPPLIVGIAAFRATDPLAQVAKNLDKMKSGG